jgi:hypothetical protein
MLVLKEIEREFNLDGEDNNHCSQPSKLYPIDI